VLQAGLLVTLGGRHLLDGLVIVTPMKHARKIVRCSREVTCEGFVLTPREIVKSNTSRACH
jgi:hypothetical protein